MKLTNLVSKTHQSFASVFLAFSLFGFLFPHHVTGVKQTHQVNLEAGERYKNPAVHPGQPYNMGTYDRGL
jgi:hypothetical protein